MKKSKKQGGAERPGPEFISRKEAMKRAGKYAVFTAASMLFLFSPKDAQADSLYPEEPGWDW
ncbi:MAG: hypothetical protein ABFS10_14410 [Bacteroidota bacterium]